MELSNKKIENKSIKQNTTLLCLLYFIHYFVYMTGNLFF